MPENNKESGNTEDQRREERRLEALDAYHILDTIPEKEFDDLTKLASNICNTPISLINLIDQNRQWTKSQQGWDIKEIPREDSFCQYTIQNEEWMVVEDAHEDERFRESRFVQNDPNIRFYAGVNLTSSDGYNIGSLCVIDKEPRKLTEEQIEAVAARIVANVEKQTGGTLRS